MWEGKINLRYMSIVLIASAAVSAWSLWSLKTAALGPCPAVSLKSVQEEDQDSLESFMDSAIQFVRSAILGKLEGIGKEIPKNLEISGDWNVAVELYLGNEKTKAGQGKGENLGLALISASESIFDSESLPEEDVSSSRILIRLLSPPDQFAFIETEDGPRELSNDMVAIRKMDKDLISKAIKEGKDFLYRMEDPLSHGFHKRYYVLSDSFEEEVHAVYSASIIYTFLYIYDLEKDESILENLPRWGEFLMSMQNTGPGDERYGAFHYSCSLKTGEKEQRFVVGTAALSIFTLLRMHEVTGEQKYLDSAVIAGDWLLTMQRDNGSMVPYVRYNGESWVKGKLESFLYNGQVLSALSKLYAETKDQKYYEASKKIADRHAAKYEAEKGYIEDEYREKNPISNAWIVMSLIDFYKVSGDDRYKSVIFELSSLILENQNTDSENLEYRGGWQGAYSTSGMGWIGEVMADLYRFCLEEGESFCEQYKAAVVEDMRWIIQHGIFDENSHVSENFERAKGGIVWNGSEKYVRTDSVCHALNGFSRIYGYLEDKVLLSLPGKTVQDIVSGFGKAEYHQTEP